MFLGGCLHILYASLNGNEYFTAEVQNSQLYPVSLHCRIKTEITQKQHILRAIVTVLYFISQQHCNWLWLQIFPDGYQKLPKFINVLNMLLIWRHQPLS